MIGQSGKKLRQDVIETNGAALISYLRSLPGRNHVCLAEGTQSAWLYEILSPHVAELVVTNVTDSRGQKNDALDALRLAEQLRIGAIKNPSTAEAVGPPIRETPGSTALPKDQ